MMQLYHFAVAITAVTKRIRQKLFLLLDVSHIMWHVAVLLQHASESYDSTATV